MINQTALSLPRRLREAIDMPDPLYVSVVSVWEIAIKVAKAKLAIAIEVRQIGSFLDTLGIEVLPMTIDHAMAVAEPLPGTKDPFDRILLAICAVERMKLVTTDDALAGHPLVY